MIFIIYVYLYMYFVYSNYIALTCFKPVSSCFKDVFMWTFKVE